MIFTIIIFIAGLVIVMRAGALSPPTPLPKNTSGKRLPKQKKAQPKKVPLPIPLQMRRAQQALQRQSRIIEDQFRELGFGNEKLEIGKLLVALGEKHVDVKNDIVKLDEKGIDLEFREKGLDIKEKTIGLYEQQLGLKEQEIQVFLGQVLNQIKEEGINLRHRENKLDLNKRLNELEMKDLDQKEREINLLFGQDMLTINEEKFKLSTEKYDLDRRWDIIKYIEDVWQFNSGLPTADNTIEHYYKAGFVPRSPLVEENQKLKFWVKYLESQLPPPEEGTSALEPTDS